MRRYTLVALFVALAILYTGRGFLPGHTFAPLDVLLDFDAWKSDPANRVRSSNSLLTDVAVQFIPWDREILRLTSQGEWPWTSALAGDGSPLFANPQTAIFSPFTWPRLLFGLDGWALMAFLKILAAALCAWWLARELDVSPGQALFSGLVYATAGYTVVWLLFPITSVFVLLPGLAAAALRLMKQPSIHTAATVIFFAALCTAGGHPETLMIGVIGIWIFLWLEADRRRDLGLGSVIPPSAGALLGFLLMAVQLVPFLTILSRSYAEVLRPQMPHPFRVWAIASQILPGILGSPLRGELDLTAIPAAENFNLRAGGYIGAIVLLAIAVAWRELTPSLKRGLAIGITGLALSWYLPGVWPLLRHMPVLRLLTLEYTASLFVLFGSIAAGPALSILAVRQRRRLGLAVALTGFLFAVSGVIPAIPGTRPLLTKMAHSGIEDLRTRGHLQQDPQVYEERLAYYLQAAGATTLRRVAIPGACWLAAGVMLLIPMRRRVLGIAAAASVELVAFGLGFNPAVPMPGVPEAPDAIRAVQRLDSQGRHLIAAHFEVFPANAGALYGVRDVVSYDAMSTKKRVTQLQPAGYDPLLHTIPPILGAEESRALAKLGVRFVLSRVEVPEAVRLPAPPPPAVGVYELQDPQPVPPPANHRPAGLIVGLVISAAAFLASAAWLRLYTLEEPRLQEWELRA